MATLEEYRQERIKKLEALRALGIDPYPAKSHWTVDIRELLDNYAEAEGKSVNIVGRITSIRSFGKLAFIVIDDSTAKIQLFIKSDTLEPLDAEKGHLGMEQLKLLDLAIEGITSSTTSPLRIATICGVLKRRAASSDKAATCWRKKSGDSRWLWKT